MTIGCFLDIPISVIERGGEFYVSSLQVAEHFEKEHHNVLKAIANLEVPENFRLVNFDETSRKDSQGIDRKMILMTRDGFVVLAMGFTGPKAMTWKIRYIEAFNTMEQELLRIGGPEWLHKRFEGKVSRKQLTDAISKFVKYAIEQGSKTYKSKPFVAYTQFTKAEYKILFNLSKVIPDLRDKLKLMDLSNLATAERIVARSIIEEVTKGKEYHEIFQISKTKLYQFIALVGPADKNYLLQHKDENPFTDIPKLDEGEDV